MTAWPWSRARTSSPSSQMSDSESHSREAAPRRGRRSASPARDRQTSPSRRPTDGSDNHNVDEFGRQRNQQRERSPSPRRNDRGGRPARRSRSRSRDGGRDGHGGRGGYEPRPGDWTCDQCGASVFASKAECYRCRTPRPGGASVGLRRRRLGSQDPRTVALPPPASRGGACATWASAGAGARLRGRLR